jgi:hypothetical protein
MKVLGTILLLAGLSTAVRAESLTGLCMVSVAHNAAQDIDTADLMLRRSSCGDDNRDCGTSENTSISWTRWTGISPEYLKQEGAQFTGRMSGEAGDLQCSGTVHDGVLAGRYQFTPNATFAQSMASMGFDGITPRKQEGFLLLDINTAWVRDIRDLGVTDLSTGKLMGLRALHVDRGYIQSMAAAGYPELRASKLTEMKAVGVTPEKVREAKSMGFQPTEQELIQMSIFKIDRQFVERMRARGLTDLSLAKLIKVKIFKLED